MIVAGDGPSLFGRNWLDYVQLGWKSIRAVTMSETKSLSLQQVMRSHEVFKEELGTVRSLLAKLHVRPDAHPQFRKAQPIPFSIKDAIKLELYRLESSGVITKVTHSEWAASIVPVPKKDGRFRICGDFKVSINPALDIDQYPLPKPEDLFATLAGGANFTKLDLSQAYQQLTLHKDSMQYFTINTHRGLYRYNCLPFGISSTPAIFQKLTDTVLQGIPRVICYLDDILITGRNDEEHLTSLSTVLQRLQKYAFRLKREKCEFLQRSVEYLGHRINSEGLHAISSKLQAITQAPAPQNVQELRSFLGLLNYYGKLIPNLASLIQPLNSLLQHDRKWKWSSECTQAFSQVKRELASSRILVHYDPTLPITLASDASSHRSSYFTSHA